MSWSDVLKDIWSNYHQDVKSSNIFSDQSLDVFSPLGKKKTMINKSQISKK